MNANAQQTGTAVAAFKPNEVLASMEATGREKGMSAVFLPRNLGEAIALGNLMAESNWVPAHLRGKPGDCVGVVIQASNWGMNAYPVANKTYFVNGRMAFEAQLVNAVVNTSNVLDGRLSVTWDGAGENMICKVSGKIKGDPEIKTIWQEMRLITVRNSPLWKSSPQMQIAYYTTRMWGRLYTPEVLMGVYTPDELEDFKDVPFEADGSQVAPPRPTRLAAAAKEAGDLAASTREAAAAEAAPQAQTRSDTASVADEAQSDDQATEPTPVGQRSYAEVADEIIDAIRNARDGADLRTVMDTHSEAAEELRIDAPAEFKRIDDEIRMKRAGLPRR